MNPITTETEDVEVVAKGEPLEAGLLKKITLEDLQIKSDTKFDALFSDLEIAQNAYFTLYGKYFQLLESPIINVIDGTDSDFSKRHPSDEIHSANVSFEFSNKIPFNIVVHEWGGPDGFGYKCIAKITLREGLSYAREKDSDSNDSGWYLIEPINI